MIEYWCPLEDCFEIIWSFEGKATKKFCPIHGKPLISRRCSKCGRLGWDKRHKYCSHCGEVLTIIFA